MASVNSLLITQLYVGYYNRAPDPEGLNYWLDRYSAGMSLIEIANSFSVQVESTTTYPWLKSPNLGVGVTEFITSVYQNLFERAPDADGLAYWSAQLLGGKPPGRFILDVISGAQGDDEVIIQRKTEVANYYADQAVLAGVTWTVEDDLAAASAALDGDRAFWLGEGAVAAAKTEVDGIIAAEIAALPTPQDPPLAQDPPIIDDSAPTGPADPSAAPLTTETDIEFTTTGTHAPALSEFGIANVTFSNNATFSLGNTDNLHTINVASSTHRISLIDMDSTVTTINVTGLQAPGDVIGPGGARHDFWYVDGGTLTMNWTSAVAEDKNAGELYFRDIETVTFNHSGPFDTRFLDSIPDGDDSVFQFDDSLLNLTINNKGTGDMYLLGADDDEAIAATRMMRNLSINATGGDVAIDGDVDTILNVRNLTLSAAGGNYLALDDIGSPDDDINGGSGLGERLEIVNVTTGSNSEVHVGDLRADRSSISTFNVTVGNDGAVTFDEVFAQDISDALIVVNEEGIFDVAGNVCDGSWNFINQGDNLVVKGAGFIGDFDFSDEAFAFMDFNGLTVDNVDIEFCEAEFGSVLIATQFDDDIEASQGNDDITSGLGNDHVDANAGNDVITDVGGDNTIRGDFGNDTINIAGPGRDKVIVGLQGPANFDAVNGFNIATDRISVDLSDMSATGGLPVDGNGNALLPDGNPTLQTISTPTVINGNSEIFIIDGTFATSGAVENAIGFTGGHALFASTAGSSPNPGQAFIIGWADTSGNFHVSAANIINQVGVSPGVEGYNFQVNDMAVVMGVPALGPQEFETIAGELAFSITRIAPADGTISEEAGESTTFSITLAGDPLSADATASVTVNVGGSVNDAADVNKTVYQAIEDAITALGANPGISFDSGTGILTFEGGGPTSLSFTMAAVDDALVEGPENLVITLSDAVLDCSCDTVAVANGVASVVIVDTDAPPPVNLPPVITGPNDGDDYGAAGEPDCLQVDENQTAVATVTATDPNNDVPLTFSIVNTADTDFAQFTIDATTGVLTFINAPDFENPTDVGGADGDNEYWVDVQVKDPGGLTDTQRIIVCVEDVNENLPPVITGPNDGDDYGAAGEPDCLQVDENQTAVATVTATDPNNDVPLTFSIVNTADTDFAQFTIDATTGVLTFINAPDFENPTDVGGADGDNEYWVDVQVKDPGGLTDTQRIIVCVEDVQEADPCDFDDLVVAPGVGVVIGDDTNNSLQGANDAEVIIGRGGDDDINGNGGGDTIYGQRGNDTINGNNDDDDIHGGSGNDTIDGSNGNDEICGGSGNDSINGGSGADTLIGGYGADTINVGNGADNDADIVRFERVLDFADTVSNFGIVKDVVQFGADLNVAYDDINNDDNFQFATGNGVNNDDITVNLDTTFEALLLSGIGGEGVSNGNLGNAAAVAAEFNGEFNITASMDQDALLVVNDTDSNSFALWQYVEAGGAEIQVAELSLIGIFSTIGGNATTTNFDFI